MPFTSPVLDDANRANGGPGSNWTADPAAGGYTVWNVAANAFAPSTTFSAMYWNPTKFAHNQEAFATVVTQVSGVNNKIFLGAINLGATWSAYTLIWDATSSYLHKYAAGVDTAIIANLSTLFAAGDKVGLIRLNTTIIAGRIPSGGTFTSLGSVQDNTIVGPGFIGMHCDNDVGGSIDDFSGGSLDENLIHFNPLPFIAPLRI